MRALKVFFSTFIFSSILLGASAAFAQSKARIDLDDMMIKGELHNDDRVMILSRKKDELKNYVKFRSSYRDEILQEAPKPEPKKKF